MKSIFYKIETGEIVSVSDGIAELSFFMAKAGLSVFVTEKSIPKNVKAITIENGIATIEEALPTVTVMESLIIPSRTKKITIERDKTGLGDTISVLSALQQMRKSFPDTHILFRAWKPYIEMLKNHPDIDELQDMSEVEVSPLGDDEVFIDIGNPCPAGNYESKRQSETNKSRNELFTIACGLNWFGERPKLYLTEEEKQFGWNYVDAFSDSGRNNLGIVLRSAETWKDWKHTADFIELVKDEYNIYAFDETLSIDIDGVKNVARDSLPIREFLSVLPYMDCVITPDTGTMHICDALDVPCIALFGSMIGEFYKTKYPNSLSVIQGKCIYDKKPCFYDVCEGKGNYQPCMNSITPEYVAQKVDLKISTGKTVTPSMERLMNVSQGLGSPVNEYIRL